ncbi:MAG: DUF885 domain-containing protein [Pseudomonadota bacterium]
MFRTALMTLPVAAAFFGGCAGPAPAARADDASARLAAFFDEVFEERLARDPEYQTQLGIKTDYDRWTPRTEAWLAAGAADDRRYLDTLRRDFDPAALSPEDRLSLRLFEYDAEQRLGRYRWRHYYYALEHRRGVQSQSPAFLINTHAVTSTADARAYIARLSGMGTLFDEAIGQARMAAAAGVIPPRFVLERTRDGALSALAGRPFDPAAASDSALLEDFRGKVERLDVSPGIRRDLIAAAETALVETVAPAYERLVDATTLLSQRATQHDGVWQFPDGADFYAFELERRTTVPMSAADIHTLGLNEVARIHDEMRGVMAEVGFDGTLGEFFEFMRSDPQFYYPDTDAGRRQYLDAARAAIDAMRSRSDRLFTLRPRAELVVKRVEPFRERSAGKAFYQRPAADGSRPGIYYANLYRMDRMPIYQLEALAYHEGIPGHHMQIAIQQEREGLPRFRRFGSITAYSEGWGLYTEWLPLEVGAYADPYSNFGRLAMELWRACRLVVDTGLHAKRWTREEAVQYLLDNTPNAEGDARSAIDRYIVMPGQATAYKIGMIEIQALRRQAEAELGSRFDLRRFHDVVLGSGPVPLPVLRDLVAAHIAERRR